MQRYKQKKLKPPDELFEKAERLYRGRENPLAKGANKLSRNTKSGENQELARLQNYSKARDLYQQIVDNYPYSKFTPMSEIRVGDCYYKMENYLEAITAYQNFINYRSSRPEVPYAMYQVGMSYKSLMRKVPRDQTQTKEALKWFQDLKKKFPDSEYAQKADAEILEVRKQLAERELYVADFYYKQEDYWAAILRYANLVKDYPDLEYKERSLYQIAQCYERLSRPEEARNFYKELIEQYPQGKFADKARDRLKEGKAPAPVQQAETQATEEQDPVKPKP